MQTIISEENYLTNSNGLDSNSSYSVNGISSMVS